MNTGVIAMPKMPEGWKQINFRAPEWWLDAARRLQERARQSGELISFEEACRRLYRKGAEAEGVWSDPALTPE